MSTPDFEIRAKPALDHRQEKIAEARARTGIDEAMIDRLVRTFYTRIQADETLGPVFAERIVDWEPHLRQMNAFWASVTLSSGTYEGTPMQKHLGLPIQALHFERWLSLFEAAARDVCPARAAEVFVERARRIAESLQFGISSVRGIIPVGAGNRRGP